MAPRWLRDFLVRRGDAALERGACRSALKWFRLAGDHSRRGEALLMMSDHSGAYAAFCRGGDWLQAGNTALVMQDFEAAEKCFIQDGDYLQAAGARHQSGDFDGAVELLLEKGMVIRAAAFCENAGKRARAAEIYLQAGHTEDALRLYRSINDVNGMLAVYRSTGGLSAEIERLRQTDEKHIAALICAADMRFSEAADILSEMKLYDQACDLYLRAEDFQKAGELFEMTGQLDRAAQCFENVPGSERKVAALYESIVLLQQTPLESINAVVFAAAWTPDQAAMVLASQSKEILLASGKMEILWRFRPGGGYEIASVAVSADGELIAVSAAISGINAQASLILLNREKKILYEIQAETPARAMAFLPESNDLMLAVNSDVCRLGSDLSPKWKVGMDFAPWSIALSSDQQSLYVSTLGGAVQQLDLDGKKMNDRVFPERVHCVRTVPGSNSLLLGMGDRTVIFCSESLETIWEIEFGQGLRFVEWLPATGHILAGHAQGITILNPKGTVAHSTSFDARPTAVIPSCTAKEMTLFLLNGDVVSIAVEDRKAIAADYYFKAGDLRKAAEIYSELEDYKQACRLFREIGDFKNAAAIMHLSGDIRSAAQHYELVGDNLKAAELFEENGDRSQAAKCYGKAGEFLKAANLSRENSDFLIAADFFERAGQYKEAADLFLQVNQPLQAIPNYEKYLASAADDYNVLYTLGDLYFEAKDYDQAIRCLQKAAGGESTRSQALKKLGECFLAKDLCDIAIDRFNEALNGETKVTTSNIDVFYLIGRAHEKARRFDEAKDIFGKVLAVDYYYLDSQTRLSETQRMSAIGLAAAGSNPAGGGDFRAVQTQALEAAKDRYHIIRKVGEGGMGVVYLARDQRLERNVAWKVLPSHLSANEDYRSRFMREARAIAQLSNRYIVSIYDIVSEAGECSIAMEFIDGPPLRSKLRDLKQLSIQQTVRYASQVCEALSAAHKTGIIHRDMKPENIMITDADDEVRVVDFGLARLVNEENMTMEGVVMGTVQYMAPEQIRGLAVDGRADIYALGNIIFEMLSGRTPFVGENILAQHLQLAPPHVTEFCPDVPQDLDDIIQDCMAKDPEARPRDCAQINSRLGLVTNQLAALRTM